MKSHTLKKSSYTLPPEDVKRVLKLKKHLKMVSNTQVMRLALIKLEQSIDLEWLKQEFKKAADVVKKGNSEEFAELGDIEAEIGE